MAQVDYFLKIDGVDGESDDDQFPKWIEISSWSYGATVQPVGSATGGAGAGKVSMKDISIQDKVNAASATLFQYCASGKKIAWAELDCRRAGDTPQVFLKIKIYDVLIANIHFSDAPGDDALHKTPSESFHMNFAKIEMQYGATDDKGKVTSLDKKMSHDLRTNKSG